MVSGIWDAARQFPALALLAWLALFVFKPRVATKASLAAWLGLAAACKVFPAGRDSAFSDAAALVAPSVPLLYAAGQMMEFLHPSSQTRERGARLPLGTDSAGLCSLA